MRTLATALALILVAGCLPTQEEVAAAHHAKCVELGFEGGTDSYSNCRLALHTAREDRIAASLRAATAPGTHGNPAVVAPSYPAPGSFATGGF